jgi:hypothetical protein
MVYLAALALAVLSIATRRTRSMDLDRMVRVGTRLAVPAALLFLAAHTGSGLVWMAKVRQITAAGLAVRADVRDEEWMFALHPRPDVIYRTVDLMRDDPDRGLVDPMMGAGLSVAERIPPCDGVLEIERVYSALATSMRLNGQMQTTSRRAVILDATGVVIGLAEPAPLVDTPDVSRDDVIARVTGAMTGGDRRAPRWFGFAHETLPPYTLVALADDATPTCEAKLLVK